MRKLTRRYVERALADNGVVELRHQLGKWWTSGWFDNVDDLLACARELCHSGNLFISQNRSGPRVASNTMNGLPVRDEDIQFFTRLFLDFDAVRPKGCSSTREELQAVIDQADICRQFLRAMGLPDPLVAISGNGAHLVYRCHLPNTEEVRQQMKAIYTGLKADYSTDEVDFDPVVRNPGRIGTFYGSYKRKGENTPDRPHRQSEIITWPRDWKQIPRKSFDALAEFYALRDQPPATVTSSHNLGSSWTEVDGSGDYGTLDAVAWFAAHGLYEHHIDGVIHAVKCPWEGEHTEQHRNDTIIFANTDGSWPGFHCKHSHCEGRGIQDVMLVMGDADQFCTRSWERENEI